MGKKERKKERKFMFEVPSLDENSQSQKER